jgi:hypothetical protein
MIATFISDGDKMKNKVFTIKLVGLTLDEIHDKLGEFPGSEHIMAIAPEDIFEERDKWKAKAHKYKLQLENTEYGYNCLKDEMKGESK